MVLRIPTQACALALSAGGGRKPKAVIYKTADYHKPWNIGVTPDPGYPDLH